MPVGNVLVGDTRGDIEHDDTALSVNVVSITETTELLLTGGIPDIELDGTKVLTMIISAAVRQARVMDGLLPVPWAKGRGISSLTVVKPRG